MIANTNISDDKGKPFSISDHCHGPIECKKIKNVINRKAAETNDTPSSIYQDSISQVENIIAFEDDEIDLVTYFEENYVIGKIRMRFRKKEATHYDLRTMFSN